MKQPESILEPGTRVRTHETLTHTLPGVRRPNASGTIAAVVCGMGGDVYNVDHEDGTRGAYCFDEFELESQCESNDITASALITDIDGDVLLADWTLDRQQSNCVMTLRVEGKTDSIRGVALDLDGITELRAALDKAEAAWKARTAPIERAYRYPDPPPPGPGMRDIVFERRPMDIASSEQQIAALKAAIGERGPGSASTTRSCSSAACDGRHLRGWNIQNSRLAMICGHDRETLREALEYAEFDPEDSAKLAEWQGPCDEDDKCFGQWKSTQAIHDPAKLAAMLAEALRERGVVASVFLYGIDRADGGEDVRIWRGYVNGKIQVSIGRSVRSSHSRMLTLAEFRAALLRVLLLPEGATDDDAVKALQENPS